jgi:hypothetical protein
VGDGFRNATLRVTPLYPSYNSNENGRDMPDHHVIIDVARRYLIGATTLPFSSETSSFFGSIPDST